MRMHITIIMSMRKRNDDEDHAKDEEEDYFADVMLVVVVVMIPIMVLVRVATNKWFFLAYPSDCRNEHAIMTKPLVYFANTTIPNILEVGLAIQESCSLRITRE